jgi:hypothetical protein
VVAGNACDASVALAAIPALPENGQRRCELDPALLCYLQIARAVGARFGAGDCARWLSP